MKEKGRGEEGKDLVADVFSSLGHETRRRIVWELGRWDQPLSFSELMGAVGVEDTGTFGFHLKALSAIIQQEKDAKYRLSSVGRLAYELVSRLQAEAPSRLQAELGKG